MDDIEAGIGESSLNPSTSVKSKSLERCVFETLDNLKIAYLMP